MAWHSGILRFDDENGPRARLCLPHRSGLHCGDPLEIKRDGEWQRGRVELDGRGWYWTNNQVSQRLIPGLEARVWEGGREWPARLGEMPRERSHGLDR